MVCDWHVVRLSISPLGWPVIWARFLSLAWSKLNYAQPITGQVTEVTCPVIGRAQPELTPSKRQKMGPGASGLLLRWAGASLTCSAQVYCVAFFWHVDTRPISPFLFFFNSTFYLCIIIVIFYLMYLIHLLKLLAIVHHTFWANVLVIQTKVLCFHCTVPECLELIWVVVSQEVYLNFHHCCG